MSGQRLEWLESGTFSISPLLCRSVFSSVGLRADCCQLRRLFNKAPDLVRYRPLRAPAEIERERLSDIRCRAEFLASRAVKAKQNQTRELFAKHLAALHDYCSQHGLDEEARGLNFRVRLIWIRYGLLI